MSAAKPPILQYDAADAQMEISAEELVALSHSRPIKLIAPASAQSTPTVSMRTSESGASGVWTSGYRAGTRLALSLVAVCVLVSAGYGLLAWRKETPSLAHIFEHRTPLHALLPEASSQAQAEPVRLKNPFDPQEVFEFSPDTTQDAAREAVAEVLMKRALARQGS
ncbi:MAG: hypothetical protein ABW106_07800 [Steroidobacteraceae bacterium]